MHRFRKHLCLTTRIEDLVHRRRIEPASLDLAERIIRKALNTLQLKPIAKDRDIRHYKKNHEDGRKHKRKQKQLDEPQRY